MRFSGNANDRGAKDQLSSSMIHALQKKAGILQSACGKALRNKTIVKIAPKINESEANPHEQSSVDIFIIEEFHDEQ